MPSQHLHEFAPDADTQKAALSGASPMTDPRFQDLTELSRRMTSSLDLRTLTEDLVSWAIRETGAATAAITLWDQERNVLMALTHLEIAGLGLKVASGEVYAELDKYPATRRVLERRQALSVKVGHPTENLGEQKWLRERGLTQPWSSR